MNYIIPLVLTFLMSQPWYQNMENPLNVKPSKAPSKTRILIDTDANNELDDQHALAYAFFNGDHFEIEGITVNNTYNGEGIQGHYDEALRVIKLCNLYPQMPLYKGAEKTYNEIKDSINEPSFDGHEAVNFIIERALAQDTRKLVLIPIGKLTNIALAILKNPEIVPKIRVVWLGSNYPGPGEYNLDNDTTAVNPVIESGVEFEMVVVRYGKPSGTDAVRTTPVEILQNMKAKGPVASETVTGRHGGDFKTFGDYALNLFEHAELHGDPPSRALFDMAAIAIVKNPSWATKREINAPKLKGKTWKMQPKNPGKIYIWENFDQKLIMQDFFKTMQYYSLVQDNEKK